MHSCAPPSDRGLAPSAVICWWGSDAATTARHTESADACAVSVDIFDAEGVVSKNDAPPLRRASDGVTVDWEKVAGADRAANRRQEVVCLEGWTSVYV